MHNVAPARLPYYLRRHGAGPTLILLHYWGGSSRTWEAVTAHLPGRDIIAIDFRGWGRSREFPGPYHLRQLAADTLDVIADADLSDYLLIGHSMGGKVAQLIAATQPPGLRGVVLVAPAPAQPGPTITADYREALSHAYDTEEAIAEARDRILTATSLSDTLKAAVAEDSRTVAAAALKEWPLHGIAEDIAAETQLITAPVLIVAGERDQIEPATVLRTNLLPHLANAEIVMVPAVGHLIPLEAPDELADIIAGFAPAVIV